MNQNDIKNKLQLAFKLFTGTQQENLEYIYRGQFNTNITDSILELAETNLDDNQDNRKVRKRVYFIMVEGLQNITRHQTSELEQKTNQPGLFVIQRKKTNYFITTGNVVRQSQIEQLKQQLDTINSLDKRQLKQYYRETLEEGRFSTKGGAGLGLIEIARKSESKLAYAFKHIKNDYHYFYLHTKINHSNDGTTGLEETSSTLESIKELHEYIDAENILLNFTGLFNQENLINLLTIIDQQMENSQKLKMRVYNVMVELLQNIVKHGVNYSINNVSGKYGIFYISQCDDHFYMTTGNYIANSQRLAFVKRIEEINDYDYKTLNIRYNTLLLSTDTQENSGIGLIDIRLKTRSKIHYHLHQTDDDYSFVSLLVAVKKQTSGMETLIIEKEKDTPTVLLDAENNHFEFYGTSIPEKPAEFYKPVALWFDNYIKLNPPLTFIDFKLKYINTTSARMLATILQKLERLETCCEVQINWFYDKNNKDILEVGSRFSKILKLNFEFIAY